MVEKVWGNVMRSVRMAIWRVVRAGLLGIVIGALAAEASGVFIEGSWPPHLFVHIAAGAFAAVLGYAAAVTMVLVEGIRGLTAAAGQLDDVVAATADAGLNVLDAAVDVVDGPNRHGIR